MDRNFKDALRHRRSYYNLSNSSPVSDEQIVQTLHFAIQHVPSAFNSQSTRLVLLLREHHQQLWQIVLDTLQPRVPAEAFPRTVEKVRTSFASGYGTVLFFEDQSVVQNLQKGFPTYAHTFPTWSQHTSAMHQLSIWTMLEDLGFGASLQHYNPLIDAAVRSEWSLPNDWSLIAQMPFGIPLSEPGDKEFEPLEKRVKIFG